jgi:hypothetical protein
LEGIADALGRHSSPPAARPEEIRLAVRLVAAAGSLRLRVGAPCSAAEQLELDRIIAVLRGLLPAEGFRVEWDRGSAMTDAQAVEAAVSHLARFAAPAGPA